MQLRNIDRAWNITWLLLVNVTLGVHLISDKSQWLQKFQIKKCGTTYQCCFLAFLYCLRLLSNGLRVHISSPHLLVLLDLQYLAIQMKRIWLLYCLQKHFIQLFITEHTICMTHQTNITQRKLMAFQFLLYIRRRSKGFRSDQLLKVTEIKQLLARVPPAYWSTQSPETDTLTLPQMVLYIPRTIFHLARLLYVRPETFGPSYLE